MSAQKRLFLLDAFALIFRGYYAFIKNPRINSKGMNTSAILGFTNSLLDVLEDYSDIYLMTEPMAIQEDEESYDEETRTEKNLPETDVFYGGTRSSDS